MGKKEGIRIYVKDRLWLTGTKHTVSRTWSAGYIVAIEIKQ